MKYVYAIVVCLFLASCSAITPLPLTKISIGMTKNEVITNLKRKPAQVIAAKKTPEGTLEVYQFANQIDTYWLYFLDDKLVQWRSPSGRPFSRSAIDDLQYGDAYNGAPLRDTTKTQ